VFLDVYLKNKVHFYACSTYATLYSTDVARLIKTMTSLMSIHICAHVCSSVHVHLWW